MEATVTIICGTILALMNAFIAYRLKEQDNKRDAARAEFAINAAKLKEEAIEAAEQVELKVDEAAGLTTKHLNEIQVLVNGRMSDALAHIAQLEAELQELKKGA